MSNIDLEIIRENAWAVSGHSQSLIHGLTPSELEDLINAIADDADATPYNGYSGRSMYGRTCWGISGDLVSILEAAGRYGLSDASFDTLGHDHIVYWPDLSCED